MAEESDWRLTNQRKYLQGKPLFWRQWTAPRESWDHDHCSFCWAKFSDHLAIPDALTKGWTTEDNYHWVCKNCCQDFSELFEWTLFEDS